MIEDCIPELPTVDLTKLLLVVNHVEFGEYKLLKSVKNGIMDKLRKKNKFKPYHLPQLISGFAQQDLLRKNKRYLLNKREDFHLENKSVASLNSLHELNQISQFFPKLVFVHSSPNYILYSKLGRIVNDSMKFISPKWQALCVYGMASVEYKNFEFQDKIVDYILNRNETEVLEEGEEGNIILVYIKNK